MGSLEVEKLNTVSKVRPVATLLWLDSVDKWTPVWTCSFVESLDRVKRVENLSVDSLNVDTVKEWNPFDETVAVRGWI